jgi:ATP-dependent helicase/nuclease subunit A
MKWTREQSEAIQNTRQSLLVSAAAGSGKTAVLAERAAHLVCDASNKCDVDGLLVVTFTNAAAAEMRARIESTLRKRLESSDDARLRRQLLLIDRAQISTLHAFCTSLLRQHFSVLGLDPGFRVLDEEEVSLIKHETARRLLDDRYETDADGEFQRFVDVYADGHDPQVLQQVVKMHDLMCSLVDRDGWLEQVTRSITEAAKARSLAKSRLGAQLGQIVTRWLGDLHERWKKLSGHHEYAANVREHLNSIEWWQRAFAHDGFDGLAREVAKFDPERLPGIRNGPPIGRKIGKLKAEMKKSPMLLFCRYTEQQWRDGLKSILPATSVLVDLVRDFDEAFAGAKRELRGVDFADLERFTLKVLRKSSTGDDLTPSPVAESCRRRFKHVLVDEYQDINQVQEAILQLVSGERNQFGVGDVKQSIYRFRLADPRRFLERYDALKAGGQMTNLDKSSEKRRRSPSHTPTLFDADDGPPGAVIDLSSNFRSRAPLLNVVNAVFERLMSSDAVEIEYDKSHRLQSGAIYPEAPNSFHGSPVEMHLLSDGTDAADDEDDDEPDVELDRTEREAAFVAQRLRQLIDSRVNVFEKQPDGTLAPRPLRYRDIVILMRSMKVKGRQVANVLRVAGIPVHTDSGSGFFDSMEVQDLIELLRLLDNQQQDIPLAAVLRSPLSGLADPEDCLARVRLAYDPRQVPFHQAVVRYAAEHSDELAAHLGEFLDRLRVWRAQAHQRPLAELIWHIYDQSGYLAFCSGMEDGQQRAANLLEFYERARQFGSFQRQGLSRFMKFLDDLAEQSDLGQPSVASEADDVVRVMSIHKSKGLEFPVVVVMDVGKKFNPADTRGSILVDRVAGIGLVVADEQKRIRYPSLAHVLVEQRIRQQMLAEEVRVLYVAMTRAREHLILVGTCAEKKVQDWRDEWGSHVGRLPPERVLGAGAMLDWLGPAAAAIHAQHPTDRIDITWHAERQVREWATRAERRAVLSDRQLRLARLEPLVPAPLVHPQAQRVIERLTRDYPHRRFTTLPAARSVGALTKTGRVAPAGSSDWHEPLVPFDIELRSPRCVLGTVKPSPTDIGSATHLVLEHLDFSRPCDRDDLKGQVAELVQRKLLERNVADVVDLDSIVWMMNTPVGALLRRNAQALFRELAIYFPLTLDSADPFDRTMVRGRADVVIPDRDGAVIVDYKTDAVTTQTVDARAEFYRPQLGQYRHAMGEILGEPVTKAVLVFLKPRVLREA